MRGEQPRSSRVVRFGVFETDLSAGELRKNGLKVKLQDHPFRVLAFLLERPGEVVTREELRQRLWSADTFVEFDHSVNTAIRKVREALGDSSDNPRFVETLPRRGYRFIAHVEGLHPDQAASETSEQQIERAQRRKQAIAFGTGALGVLLALIFAFFPLFSPAPVAETPVRRFSFPLEGLIGFLGGSISPDGKYVVYLTAAAGQRALWLRPLDSESARKLKGTEGAGGGHWSPDSQSIVFGTDRELKRISLDGGNPITLCELPGRRSPFGGASWSPDGNRIVFSSGRKLYEVVARGGEPELLFEQKESEDLRFFAVPHFLPSSGAPDGLVYTAWTGLVDRMVELLVLNTGERRELVPGTEPAYSASGHLVYHGSLGASVGPFGAGSGLRALPFSLETLTATGEAFPIVEAGRYPSVSADGTLVYLDQPAVRRQLVWRDRSGRKLLVFGQAHENVFDPALSPDGLLVAAVGFENDNVDIWIHDANRPIATRLTFDAALEHRPVWSPAGDQVAFSSKRQGNNDIFVRPADGSGEAKALVATRWPEFVSDWSSDGRYILYHRNDPKTGDDLWYLQRKDDNSGYEPVPFLQTPFRELAAKLSPDGQFVAYVSDESGRYEVYVQRFPGGGGKRLVSRNGGGQPRWRRDGKELFYVAHGTLLAIDVTTMPNLSMGSPRELFESVGLNSPTVQYYDVSADGQWFVLRELMEVDDPPVIRVVQNWFAEFRDREQD